MMDGFAFGFLLLFLQAMQQYYHGEYAQSQVTERIAKGWAICSMISGAVFIGGIILLSILIRAVLFVEAQRGSL